MAEDVQIRGDANYLARAFQNVLKNAVAYSDTSGNPNLTDDSPKLDRIKEMLEEEIIPILKI